MLRRIGLANFKCFGNLDLPCASLNLLCGLNGMGKSSVIQALLVLRQSFETGDLQDGRWYSVGRGSISAPAPMYCSRMQPKRFWDSSFAATKRESRGRQRSGIREQAINFW